MDVDTLNQWLAKVSETPAGSLVLFVGVFLVRIWMDEWQRRKDKKRKPKHHKPKAKPSV